MGNVKQMRTGVDKPIEVALMDAIDRAIKEISLGKMTGIEIIGCLEVAKLRVYTETFLE